MVVEINYNNIDFDVYGYYQAGQKGTWHNPPIAGEFEITNLFHQGHDVLKILTELDVDLTKIELAVLNKIEDK